MAGSGPSARNDVELADLAERHGFSTAAVRTMAAALARGNRRMAQFDHPEFGGHGQWMRGGMLMIGDMFNDELKARVAALCNELAQLPEAARNEPAPDDAPADWWPADLGRPNSSGGQNGIRYAYFAQPRRLVIDRNGTISVYDTGDYEISGVAQQQSHAATLSFTSQHGTLEVEQLRRV